MGLGRTIRKFFSAGEEEDGHGPDTRPQRSIRARSLSTICRWCNKGSLSERPPISAPVDPFPVLSRRMEAFDAQITRASLSQIMVWYVYYDVVQLPERGSKRFQDLPRQIMIGWIGLGMELERTNRVPSRNLWSICNRMHVDTGEVVTRLIRLSDRASMLKSGLVDTTDFEAQAKKLQSDLTLVELLGPIRFRFERWKQETIDGIQEYMEVVYLPVVSVGQFGLPPASEGESQRRNDVRTRMKEIMYKRREPPPQQLYEQAMKIVGVSCVETRQVSFSESSSPSGDDGMDQHRLGPAQPARGDLRHCTESNLDDLELTLHKMRIHCANMSEYIQQIRLQQYQTIFLQRSDSMGPREGKPVSLYELALNQVPEDNHHGPPQSRNGHRACLSDQPGVVNRSRTRKMPPKSPEPFSKQPLYRSSTANISTTLISGVLNQDVDEYTPHEWLQRQSRAQSAIHPSHNDHLSSLEDPSSHPMTRHRATYRQKRSSRWDTLDSELVRLSPRQRRPRSSTPKGHIDE